MTSGTLAPLRAPVFRWFFASQGVNRLGSTMAPIALAFAVLELSRAPWALGAVLAARTIPLVAFLLIGGVVADRLPRSLVLTVGNTLAGLTQAAAAALVISGHAEIWMLVVLEALNGTLSAITLPALNSLVPQLVEGDDLRSANLLLNLVRGLIQVGGPSISALLVVGVGPGWALGVDALTWIVSALLLLPVRLPRPGRSSSSGWNDLREGWTLFRTTQWLWVVVVAFGVLNMLSTGAISTLGPVLAKETFGPSGFGAMLSAGAAGDFVGTLVLTRIRFGRPLLAGMLACVATGVQITLFGLQPTLASQVPLCFLAGVALAVFSLAWSVSMQEHIATDKLARAWSYDALGSFVAMPVGQLLFGQLGHVYGIREVIAVGGVGYVVVCLLALLSPEVRTLRPTSPGSRAGP
ncbi:MFS transporter [Nocardioides mangrovicus]|uniref:MFS transporter n=1 Tax=Nocardioides mangrovicus TaxID=2478913 RepID=A0A3L8P302_9ACTN|nr:MFS transporter [Nocardioides mangrovicus]RLV49796.1 MFS transporter [Nocardioides mangrovicus]